MTSGLYFNQSTLQFYSSNWTRIATFTASSSGQYVICAYSEDETNMTSELYCYTMVIGITNPSIVSSSLSPIGLVYVNASMAPLYFTCKFTRIVKNPSTNAAFIRLKDASNNATVMTLDFSMNGYIQVNNDTLVFTFGWGVIQLNKTYYITLDAGNNNINYWVVVRRNIPYLSFANFSMFEINFKAIVSKQKYLNMQLIALIENH